MDETFYGGLKQFCCAHQDAGWVGAAKPWHQSTDFQDLLGLGDIVFVDLPDVGTHITAGSDIIVVESVKTAADIYAPVSGEIIEINKALHNTPETVNESPFTDGWLCKIKIADNAALSNLLSAEQYTQQINED